MSPPSTRRRNRAKNNVLILVWIYEMDRPVRHQLDDAFSYRLVDIVGGDACGSGLLNGDLTDPGDLFVVLLQPFNQHRSRSLVMRLDHDMGYISDASQATGVMFRSSPLLLRVEVGVSYLIILP